MKKASFTKFCL